MPSAIKDVSRETLGKFEIFVDQLIKWQKSINLVSNDSLNDVWGRHIDDSLQLLEFIKDKNSTLVDLGSGAGFPGLVLAIAGCTNVHLIESDLKKCTFLRNVSRETFTQVSVNSQRIEKVNSIKASVITSRGLAKITKILDDSYNLWDSSTIFLLLKGKTGIEEVAEAELKYSMKVESFPSKTSSDGMILKITGVYPK